VSSEIGDGMSVSRSERGVRRQSTGRRNDWKAKQMGVNRRWKMEDRISEFGYGRSEMGVG